MNCIWFKSLDCGYTWALLNTTLLFQLHRRSLLWSHCCWTELILVHRAGTVTFNHARIARAINTRCRLKKTKRKRRKIPSSAQSTYMTKWKLKQFWNGIFSYNQWCWQWNSPNMTAQTINVSIGVQKMPYWMDVRFGNQLSCLRYILPNKN